MKEENDEMAWVSHGTESNRTRGNEIKVYVDSAASTHIIDEDLELGSYITSTTDYNMRAKCSCGTSVARKRGNLDVRLKNSRG